MIGKLVKVIPSYKQPPRFSDSKESFLDLIREPIEQYFILLRGRNFDPDKPGEQLKSLQRPHEHDVYNLMGFAGIVIEKTKLHKKGFPERIVYVVYNLSHRKYFYIDEDNLEILVSGKEKE